jgi:hypothetical protein
MSPRLLYVMISRGFLVKMVLHCLDIMTSMVKGRSTLYLDLLSSGGKDPEDSSHSTRRQFLFEIRFNIQVPPQMVDCYAPQI